MILNRRSLLSLTASTAALAATGVWADTTATPAPAADTAPIVIQDYGLGDTAAKVKIVEYLSFTCPHCEHFHAEVYPKIKANYIDTGKVRFEYHEVYFDQMGLLGAMVARCGGEMRYFGITDMLYDKQRDWAAASDMGAATDALKKFARTAGMDDATVDACLHDQKMAEALVAHYQANIAKDFPNDSFQGTPSFLINGKPYSNMSYEDMAKIIDAELAK
ncbi:thioredoxin domain-containing protein [bacterium]|nr:thioredoxin domain-containing protein [bacterium]